MKLKQSVLFLFFLLCLSGSLYGQAWSGILDPSRAIDWSNVGIPGGIPSGSWTQCGSTIAAYSGTTAAINSQIAGCSANQYVLLGPGTFTLSGDIDIKGQSYVAVRGSGPMQTKVAFTGLLGQDCGFTGGFCASQSPILGADSAQTQPGGSNACSWTAGYSQGTTSITLNSCGGTPPLHQMLILDQQNDTSDTSGVYICDDTTTGCTTKGLGAGNADGRVIGGVDYSSQQVVYITSVSGTGSGPYTVGITPGLYMNNWRSGQNPGAWWTGTVVQDGLENLTLDYSGVTNSGHWSGAIFYGCYECWVKNVRSLFTSLNHVFPNCSARMVVRDSYFYQTANSTTQSYGLEPMETSDLLIENNIFDGVTAPFITGETQGTVFAYNLTLNNPFVGGYADYMTSEGFHNAGSGMDLWEGNNVNQMSADDTWGSNAVSTIFRNRLIGWQTGKFYQTFPVDLDIFNRGFNFIGNVMGQPGYALTYEVYPPSTTTYCNASIYELGWSGGTCSTTSGMSNDTLVRSTLMRWGNYDVVNAAVQWNSAESSPAAVPYINAQSTPASHTLPNSFYLSSQPPFWPTPWGTPPWPPIGPDVSGGSGPGGYSYPIPAQLCHDNTALDSTYSKTYSVSTATWSQWEYSSYDPGAGISGYLTVTLSGTNTLLGGEIITISGVNPPGYNGTYVLNSIFSSGGLMLIQPTNPGTYISGGTVSGPQVLAFDANSCSDPPQTLTPPSSVNAVAH
jgi:hypothetical protein